MILDFYKRKLGYPIVKIWKDWKILTVTCLNKGCYYYDRRFCAKEVVMIDENGMCSQYWRRGERWNAPKMAERVEVNLSDGDFKEIGGEGGSSVILTSDSSNDA